MRYKFWNKLIPVAAVLMLAGISLLIMLHSLQARNLREVVSRASNGHQVLQASEDLEFVQDAWLEHLEQNLLSTAPGAFPHPFRGQQGRVLQQLQQIAEKLPAFQPHVDTLAKAAAQLALFADSITTIYNRNGQFAAQRFWNQQVTQGNIKGPGLVIHQQQTAIHLRIREVELDFLEAQANTDRIRNYTSWLLAATLLAFCYALWREAQTAHALSKQAALNRGILQHLPDAAATTDNFFQVKQWNKAFSQVFDNRHAIKNADIRDLLTHWTPADTLELEAAVAEGRRWQKQWQLQTLGGDALVLDISFTQLKGRNGKHAGALWICKDITRQQHQVVQLSRRAEKLELSLKHQVDLLQQVWDKVPESIFQTDLEGRYLHINEHAARLLPVPAEKVMGKKMWESFPGLIGTNLEQAFRAVCTTGKEQTIQFDSPISNKQYRVHLMLVGTVVNISFRDLSEFNKAKHSVHTLSADMMQAREEERRRIAKELHDELGQQLTGNKVMFAYLCNLLNLTDGPLKQQFGKLDQQMTDVINKVRQLHRHFSYTQIEDLGLFEVLRHDAAVFAHTHQLQLTFNNEVEELLLPGTCSVALYHVFTEALSNIQRHARASQLSIFITLEAGQLLMEISDDGVGFDTRKMNKGLGIGALKERMRRINGRIEITSEPGQGTRLAASAPLE